MGGFPIATSRNWHHFKLEGSHTPNQSKSNSLGVELTFGPLCDEYFVLKNWKTPCMDKIGSFGLLVLELLSLRSIYLKKNINVTSPLFETKKQSMLRLSAQKRSMNHPVTWNLNKSGISTPNGSFPVVLIVETILGFEFEHY